MTVQAMKPKTFTSLTSEAKGNPNNPKSSEVTQKSPMSYEGFTAQTNSQSFYEVFVNTSTQEIKTTSQHISRVKNLKTDE